MSVDPLHRGARTPLGGLAFPVGLAPMEGVTGFPMRLWIAQTGAPDTMTTPFLRLTPTFPSGELPPDFAPEVFEHAPGHYPYRLTPQIMAVEAEHVIRALPLFGGASVVELNCGCPSPICSGKGAGSGLLKDPQAFAEMVDELVKAAGPGRLAIKMRTGYHDASEFETLLDCVKDQPLARLTVHGRTRSQGYAGKARWDLIARAAAVSASPVIASGDVVDAEALAELRKAAPGLAGAIVGRGALRNPWIFRELADDALVSIAVDALLEAMAVHAQLHDLSLERPDLLRQLAADGLFSGTPAGIDLGRWTALRRGLSEKTGIPEENGVPVTSKRTLGRVKLLWNHVRTSLWAEGHVSPFFAPELLRSGSVAALFGGIRRLAADAGIETVTFAHDEDHDRIFGRGHDPDAPPPIKC
jgi:tRNA-dihydrouridine synthase